MKNTWLFPVVQALHVIGLAILVGLIALEDYALLRGRPAARTFPWPAFAWTVLTGGALFAADQTRYLSNPAFLLKIGLVLFSIAQHFVLRRKAAAWPRTAAAASLMLWTAVVLTSRLIEDFDK